MHDEATFTRQAGDSMHKFRSYSQNFMIDVNGWDGAKRPIAIYHQEDGSAAAITLNLTAAQARAIAQELLHAADVAQQPAETTAAD